MSKKEVGKSHKQPTRIPYQSRTQLIRLVICQKISVKSAHSRLGINYSTAKMIVRKYRHYGKITQFNREKLIPISQRPPMGHIQSQEELNQNKNNQNFIMLQISGQQITNFEFSTYSAPNQQFFTENTYMNSGKLFYPIQQFIWWDPVQNYFYF